MREYFQNTAKKIGYHATMMKTILFVLHLPITKLGKIFASADIKIPCKI